jgi:hypothetical protein
MNNLLKALQISLQNKNWYAALFLALALPDICSKLENSSSMDSQKRYIEWFNKYLSAEYIHEIGPDRTNHVFLTGEDCYALRCSYLHEGVDIIGHQRCQKVLHDFIFIGTPNSHRNYIERGSGQHTLQLSVEKFCQEMAVSVETWLHDVSEDQDTQNRISKMLKIDDKWL